MKLRGLTTAAGLFGLILSAQSVMAEPNTKIGALRCNVAAGLGMIITSSKEMSCVFTSASGRHERYYGTIRKFGIDIGATNSGVLAWDVISTGAGPRRGALAGDYVGADASATVGAGAGANALVGGFGRSLSLQPISIEVQSGLALAAGVASLTLRQGG